MKAISVVLEKANVGAVLQGKSRYSGFSNEMARFIPSLSPNAQSETLLPIIREKVKPDSIVYTDTFRGYDVLDVSEFSHFRINHSTHFAENHNYINGIGNFESRKTPFTEV